MDNSISIIIPAHNEADSVRAAYETISSALRNANLNNYEIIIISNTGKNGYCDNTSNIVKNISHEDNHVRAIHLNYFTGLGFVYRKGVGLALKNYVMMVPAHNLTTEDSLIEILKHIGESDSIVTYTKNPETRPLGARFVSRCFVWLCNIMFGLKFKYYNGVSVYRRDILRRVPMSANNHAYMAEVIIYLAKAGMKVLELPQILKPTPRYGKAFSLRSAFDNFSTLIVLFWKINILHKRLADLTN